MGNMENNLPLAPVVNISMYAQCFQQSMDGTCVIQTTIFQTIAKQRLK